LVVATWTAATVLAVLQSWGGLHRPMADRLADLQVYLGSVGTLVHGGSLYDFVGQNGTAPFTYPPFAGLVFAPVYFLPFAWAAVLWCVLTFAVVVGMVIVAARHSEARFVSRQLTAPLLAVLLFASAPISSNLRFGQISVLLVAAILLDALHIASRRWRGIATGVAAAIKLTPLIFIPYYWFSGQRRTAVVSAATFAACTALGWIVLPSESTRFWFTEVWNVNRVGHITTGGNQSLNGALLRLDLADTPRSVLAAVLGGAVVIFALYRASRAYRQGRLLPAAVMVGAAGLVLSPVSWTHHQVWLVLAVLLALSATRERINLVWSALVCVLMILPVTGWGGGIPGGGFVLGNARLWLAIVIAALVPVALDRAAAPEDAAAPAVERA
jgi:alpha-1,2-mannosyltransferase